MRHYTAVLLDLDGTLVDSNDAHAHAWVETLGKHGIEVAFERVARPLQRALVVTPRFTDEELPRRPATLPHHAPALATAESASMSRITLLATSAIALAVSLIGCIEDQDATYEEDDEQTGEASSELSSSVYTPFTGPSSSGPASTYVWKGYKTTYPAGNENFRAYDLPTTVECASSKSTRSHLDVTAGCLTAVNVGGDSRGKITPTSDGAFRVVALPYTGSETNPLKWTTQSNSVRFYYTGFSGPGTDPGFKLFVRYRTENDLYVASWREDGHVNIKKKLNGSYATLAETSKARPSTGTWHTIRFDAIGSRLDFYTDGTKVLTASDSSFSWGTSGIRTDATPGALIDEWTIK
jgi:hypothetical protein